MGDGVVTAPLNGVAGGFGAVAAPFNGVGGAINGLAADNQFGSPFGKKSFGKGKKSFGSPYGKKSFGHGIGGQYGAAGVAPFNNNGFNGPFNGAGKNFGVAGVAPVYGNEKSLNYGGLQKGLAYGFGFGGLPVDA